MSELSRARDAQRKRKEERRRREQSALAIAQNKQAQRNKERAAKRAATQNKPNLNWTPEEMPEFNEDTDPVLGFLKAQIPETHEYVSASLNRGTKKGDPMFLVRVTIKNKENGRLLTSRYNYKAFQRELDL